MKLSAMAALLVAMLAGCATPNKPATQAADVLELFRQITQGKSQLQIRTGEPAQINASEKICITPPAPGRMGRSANPPTITTAAR